MKPGFLFSRIERRENLLILELSKPKYFFLAIPLTILIILFVGLTELQPLFIIPTTMISFLLIYGIWPFIIPFYKSALKINRRPLFEGRFFSKTNVRCYFFKKSESNQEEYTTLKNKLSQKKSLILKLTIIIFYSVIAGFLLEVPMMQHIQNLTVPTDTTGITWMFIVVVVIILTIQGHNRK